MSKRRSGLLGTIADPGALLEGLFEHSPVAFQVYQADGHCLLVNQAFRELFGSEPPAEYNVLEDDVLERQGFLELVRRAFLGETIAVPPHWYDPRELRQLDVHEGRRVGVQATLFPLRDAGGAVGHVAICFKNVTSELEREQERDELRSLAEALRQHEEELAITLNSIGDAVIATDTTGTVTRMNPVAEKLTGWPDGQGRGRALREVFRIFNEDSGKPVESPVERVIRDGIVVGLANHTVLMARDGNVRAIADSGAPIRDATGALRGVVLVFRDQTEERQAERALKVSEARKGAILQAALDAIVTADHEGRIIEFNPAAERTFGYARSEAIGKRLVDLLVPPSLRAKHLAGFERYLSTGKGTILGRRIEIQALRADGVEFPVELTVVATQADALPTFTAYVRDLTERKKAEKALQVSEESGARAEKALQKVEAELRQAQKMEAIGRLAGGVAHDFNNILTIVLGQAQILLDDSALSGPMREGLADITRASERAAELTRQLLAFSRRQVLQPKVLNLNEKLDGMTRMLTRVIGEDIELAVRKGSGLGAVLLDPGQVEQVILNLAVNARDAMPQGGKLTIETANVDVDESYAHGHLDIVPGPHVMLSVSDTGVGMDRQTQEHVFEPFFTTKSTGTGLGLATVFGIVKQSQGSVWVYSEPGAGTTFKIYFPRRSPETELARTVRSKVPHGPRGEETILLVEDSAEVSILAKRMLERGGYRVLAAANGADAERVFEQHSGAIHLLVTDVVMPGMSGRMLAERLTARRPIKVLYMSGYTDDAVVRHGVLEEGVRFIQKPFTPDGLLAKVREALDTDPR